MAEMRVLRDEDIETTWTRAGGDGTPAMQADPDTTDPDTTDTTDTVDTDATDADTGTDADGTDTDTDTQDS